MSERRASCAKKNKKNSAVLERYEGEKCEGNITVIVWYQGGDLQGKGSMFCCVIRVCLECENEFLVFLVP